MYKAYTVLSGLVRALSGKGRAGVILVAVLDETSGTGNPLRNGLSPRRIAFISLYSRDRCFSSSGRGFLFDFLSHSPPGAHNLE